MKKNKLEIFQGLVLLFLIFIIQMPFSIPAIEMPSLEVINAAQEGVGTFLKGNRMKDLQQFGFPSQKEVDEATLGQGFQVFTVSPNDLLDDSMPKDLHRMAVPTNIWQFLIMTEQGASAVLTVDIVNNKWTAVSIGASGLAKQLQQMIIKWPLSSGYNYRLIRVFQAKADFIEISQEGRIIGFVPLTPARMALGLEKMDFDPSDLHSSDEIINQIGPIVKRNLQE